MTIFASFSFKFLCDRLFFVFVMIFVTSFSFKVLCDRFFLVFVIIFAALFSLKVLCDRFLLVFVMIFVISFSFKVLCNRFFFRFRNDFFCVDFSMRFMIDRFFWHDSYVKKKNWKKFVKIIEFCKMNVMNFSLKVLFILFHENNFLICRTRSTRFLYSIFRTRFTAIFRVLFFWFNFVILNDFVKIERHAKMFLNLFSIFFCEIFLYHLDSFFNKIEFD